MAAIALSLVTPARSEVFTYECEAFPPDAGWEVIQEVCYPDQWLEEGSLFHHVAPCPGVPGQGGQQVDYRRYLADFLGEEEFFVEWRVETDGHASENWGSASALLSVSGSTSAVYHFSITRDVVRFVRVDGQWEWVPIEPNVTHTYRLELYGDVLYIWYIDGVVIFSGLPDGASLTGISDKLSWRTKSYFLDNTTRWDYIRYGTIPQLGSGDFDSDGTVDEDDIYFFFLDCLLGPDADGPGCRFADMNRDGVADGRDVEKFVVEMLDP